MSSEHTSERRTYAGPAFFSFGFRPFFFAGSVFAALSILVWALAYVAGTGEIGGRPALEWHIHEMLFGFFAAIAVGFLLTAIPNWTGRLPVAGLPLAMLFALWLAGRAAMLLPGGMGMIAAVIDPLFLVLFAAVACREVIASRNIRNWHVCVLVSVLAIANIAFHMSDTGSIGFARFEQLAIAVPAILIAIIGGRIVPSFTRNWLVQRGSAVLPVPANRFDQIALGIVAAALLAWVIMPGAFLTGVLLVMAGGMHGIRLARWRGWLTGAEALVWILHVGYGWLVLSLVLLGAAILWPLQIPASAAIHALTAGAIGVMTLAVMTRATLGHTGRARTADGWTIAIYILVNAAALLRVGAGIVLPASYASWIAVSALLWAGAFTLFAVRYGPMLVLPRR